MGAGRPTRSLADLQAETAAARPQLDDISGGTLVVLEPHRTLREIAAEQEETRWR